MNTIEKLAEIFKDFPGIGERQAKRFVYFLMSRDQAYVKNVTDLMQHLKKEISQCKECYKFFLTGNQKKDKCEICSDPNIDSSLLMVLEKDSDLESMHKSGNYHGKYFVLGGLVPIVEKTTKRKIRVNELVKKVSGNTNLKEIILAFSFNPQGNHTDLYLREELGPITEKNKIKVTSLGKGLSTGTELEYSDNDTLNNALKNRQ